MDVCHVSTIGSLPLPPEVTGPAPENKTSQLQKEIKSQLIIHNKQHTYKKIKHLQTNANTTQKLKQNLSKTPLSWIRSCSACWQRVRHGRGNSRAGRRSIGASNRGGTLQPLRLLAVVDSLIRRGRGTSLTTGIGARFNWGRGSLTPKSKAVESS